jgi:hypothetical protein
LVAVTVFTPETIWPLVTVMVKLASEYDTGLPTGGMVVVVVVGCVVVVVVVGSVVVVVVVGSVVVVVVGSVVVVVVVAVVVVVVVVVAVVVVLWGFGGLWVQANDSRATAPTRARADRRRRTPEVDKGNIAIPPFVDERDRRRGFQCP